MAWIEPITNRTNKDKYNASDLNRVENNVKFLVDLLGGYGYHADLDFKLDWAISDIPTVPEMIRYLKNIRDLIDIYYTLPNTPAPPETMARLTHIGANNIEAVLRDINQLIENMTAAYRYCGEFYAGEE